MHHPLYSVITPDQPDVGVSISGFSPIRPLTPHDAYTLIHASHRAAKSSPKKKIVGSDLEERRTAQGRFVNFFERPEKTHE